MAVPRLASMLLFAAIAAAAHAAPATRDEQITLVLDDGRALPATVRIPHGAQAPQPALMIFGGFQRAATVLDRVPLDPPLIRASFDYPYEPPRGFRFPDSLGDAPEMRAAIQGTFAGVVALHAALRTRPDVDPARITVVGASAGAPFALVGAARSGIPGLILVQGFADAERVVENLIARKHRAKYGALIEWPAFWFARWILWYVEAPDLSAHARQLGPTQKVLMVTASEDNFIPREASEALWTALGESRAQRTRIDLPGGHLGVGDDSQRIAEIMRRAVTWMEREGLR